MSNIHVRRRTFSRSYGTILPSSFTRVISRAWVFSTCPPVSVFSTVVLLSSLRDFSWKQGISYFCCLSTTSSSPLSIIKDPVFPKSSAYQLKPSFHHLDSLAFSVLPSLLKYSTGFLTCFPSVTLFSLTLGADSPCADFRRAGNLGLPAWQLLTAILVTHVSIRSSDTSSILLNTPSSAYRMLLYRNNTNVSLPKASVDSFSPVSSSAQADSTSELLRFL